MTSPVGGEVGAVEEGHRDGDVADELDARHEPGDQPEGHEVGGRYVVVDVVEDLEVARLAAERLDRADAAHRLDEVDDQQRDLLARDAVGLGRRLRRNHAVTQVEERPADQRDQPELDVEEHQDHGGADQGQERRDQAVEPGLEHLVDRVDVGGLARDDATRGVVVVERRAEPLEVAEDPAAQLVEEVLADPARAQQEQLAGDRLDDRRAEDESRRRPASGPRSSRSRIGGMPESMPTLTR